MYYYIAICIILVIEWSATNHDDGPLVQVTSPSQASQNHNGYDDITSEQEESGTPVQEESSGHVTPSCTPNAATPCAHNIINIVCINYQYNVLLQYCMP